MLYMVFASKKGMSPLIATVLLIAFAVALGAMIMNWSAGVAPDEDHVTVSCAEIKIANTKNVCISENKLMYSLRNEGDARVDSVRLVVTDAFGVSTFLLQDSAFIPSEAIEGVRPYVYDGGSIKLDFIPLLSDGQDGFYACEAEGFTQTTLLTC